jgi:pyruvate kinase
MRELLDAGVDVVRINASHGTPELRSRWIQDLQVVLRERTRSAAILMDLRGPRIRVGTLPSPIQLTVGDTVVFAPEDTVDEGQIPTTYRELAGDVKPGTRILLNDGLLSCEVIRIEGERVYA